MKLAWHTPKLLHIWVNNTSSLVNYYANYSSGIIHREMKDEGHLNSTVYGITSDGNEFRFYRCDNNSVVSFATAALYI